MKMNKALTSTSGRDSSNLTIEKHLPSTAKCNGVL